MKKKYKILIFLALIVFVGVIFSDIALADTYENYDKNSFISCGNKYVENVPKSVPKAISIAYTIIQIVVPILLVVFGMIDLVKGITSQKEDEIKAGYQKLMKRLLAGALVFFLFVIVKFIISIVADNSGAHSFGRIMDCAECFIENNSKCVSDTL